MNPYSTILMPPRYPYNDESYFFYTFLSHIKFALVALFFFVLVLVLLWNWQPWFKLEIKPIHQTANAATKNTNDKDFNTSLESNDELNEYLVRPGDTLSEIAARFGVSLSVLIKYNGIDNPNVLRYGQRLKIPPSTGINKK